MFVIVCDSTCFAVFQAEILEANVNVVSGHQKEFQEHCVLFSI